MSCRFLHYFFIFLFFLQIWENPLGQISLRWGRLVIRRQEKPSCLFAPLRLFSRELGLFLNPELCLSGKPSSRPTLICTPAKLDTLLKSFSFLTQCQDFVIFCTTYMNLYYYRTRIKIKLETSPPEVHSSGTIIALLTLFFMRLKLFFKCFIRMRVFCLDFTK